ncbi:MAG: hypothetical protein ABFS19_10900 [Thermodesulfobacteriota bacterium]
MRKTARLLLILAIVLQFIAVTAAVAATGSYIGQQLQSTSRLDRVKGAKLVYFNKVQNDAIFDIINQQLLAGYNRNPENPKHIDELSWYCKALATSTNRGYLETLKTVGLDSPSDKLRKYAREAYYKLESQVVIQDVQPAAVPPPEMTIEEQRVYDMLLSGEMRKVRDAAKILSKRRVTLPFLYDTAAQILEQGYSINRNQHAHVDTMAWLCKAVGASGNQQYLPLLDTVAQRGPNSKLRDHAKRAFFTLQ